MAANPPHAAAAVDRWDRQTDRQSDGHRTVKLTLPPTMQAVSIIYLYAIGGSGMVSIFIFLFVVQIF